MIPRKQLDLGWNDIAFGAIACLRSFSSSSLEEEIDHAFGSEQRTLATLSVRSGFDALLTSLDWPPGTEVLVSAVTIRDMPRLLIEHGLRPVSVDLDVSQLTVTTEQLAKSVTPRTRGILIAHLFGSLMEMEPIVAFARSRGLFIMEDCAQAFRGPEFVGHPECDVCLFSFGLIKTATAIGGAVLVFRDRIVRDRVAEVMSTWPRQTRFGYLQKVLRSAVLRGISSRRAFSLFSACCRWSGTTHDAVISRSVRGFAGDGFMDRIRHQPSQPLLATLARRLRQTHTTRLGQRRDLAERILAALPGISRPGDLAGDQSHWVLPIHHHRPDELVRHLWRCGFDATRGASSMAAITADDPSLQVPQQAIDSFQRIVYLPLHESMTAADVQRLAAAIHQFDLPTR